MSCLPYYSEKTITELKSNPSNTNNPNSGYSAKIESQDYTSERTLIEEVISGLEKICRIFKK